MKGIIYTATNKVNGKVYVGQTIQSLKERKAQHKFDAKTRKFNSYFHNSIRKYGFGSFKWEVVAETDNIDILNELEIFYITLYNSRNKKKGYNIKEGGLNGKHSEESKKKMSEAHKGKTHSKETCQKMGKARIGDKNPFYRHDLDDNEIIRLYDEGYSTREIGKKCSCSKYVVQNRLKKNGKKLRNGRESRKKEGLFGFTGIGFRKDQNPEMKCWISRIQYNKKSKFLGYFSDPISAEMFYTFAKKEIERLEEI